MPRTANPATITRAERNRLSRASRAAKAVLLPGSVIEQIDAMTRPGETRASATARIILDASRRSGVAAS